jgi:hypothetical protein
VQLGKEFYSNKLVLCNLAEHLYEVRKMSFIYLTLTLFTISYAQVDTIRFNNGTLKFDHMQFGKATYLVYMQNSKGQRSNLSIWTRELKKNDDDQTFIFEWNTAFDKSDDYWQVHTVLDAKTFLPREESSRYRSEFTKMKEIRKQFTFLENTAFSSSDTLKHNTKETSVSYQEKPFNWQLDMETFSLLPLKAGASFAINFYHPGGPKPAFHIYTVIGSDTVHLNGVATDCWLLKTEYGKGNYGKWWINKNTHQVLKLEEKYNQNFRFKILIEQDLL